MKANNNKGNATAASDDSVTQNQPNFRVDLEGAKKGRKNYIEYCEANSKPIYPYKFDVTTSMDDFIQKFSPLEVSAAGDDSDVHSIAARVFQIRAASKKLYFLDLQSTTSNLQAMANLATYDGEEEFKEIMPMIKRGDIVGVTGTGMRTKAGELTIKAKKVTILTPCFELIPSNFYGLKDTETRYRHRYLDLLVNKPSREILITRFKTIHFLRQYLVNLGFVEVETPILHEIPGGATAKPFTTTYNAIDSQMYLRIAPELYLKELVVGGMNRVFEIGKNFRNEDMDTTHNPEFTSLEFYMAYADYNDLMDITEDMLSKLVKEVTGSYIVKFTNENGTDVSINFERPWKRVDIVSALEEKTETKFDCSKFGTEESRLIFDELCTKYGIKCEAPRTENRLFDKMIGHFLESEAFDPTFLINHPLFMSPLAKRHRTNPHLSERFEVFSNKFEICNAYTESNNVFDQHAAFMQQASFRDGGDDESMLVDHKFLSALSYGLPPTAGWGLGIDRFIMLLTNSSRIKEVIAFPTCKPELSIADAHGDQSQNSKKKSLKNKMETMAIRETQKSQPKAVEDSSSGEDCDMFAEYAEIGEKHIKCDNVENQEKPNPAVAEDSSSGEDCDMFAEYAEIGEKHIKCDNVEDVAPIALEDSSSGEDCDMFAEYAEIGEKHIKCDNVEDVAPIALEDSSSGEDCNMFAEYAEIGEKHIKCDNVECQEKPNPAAAEDSSSGEDCDMFAEYAEIGEKHIKCDNVESQEKHNPAVAEDSSSGEDCDMFAEYAEIGEKHIKCDNVESQEKPNPAVAEDSSSGEDCDMFAEYAEIGEKHIKCNGSENP